MYSVVVQLRSLLQILLIFIKQYYQSVFNSYFLSHATNQLCYAVFNCYTAGLTNR